MTTGRPGKVDIDHAICCVERLRSWIGKPVRVTVFMQQSRQTLDRHVTTRSAFAMELEGAAMTFSGALVTLHGKNLCDYQRA